jgi:hypothetical protein
MRVFDRRATGLRAINSNEDRCGLMLPAGAYTTPTHKGRTGNSLDIKTFNPLNNLSFTKAKRRQTSGSGIRAD